jgi:hypothetical protein
VTVAAIQTGAEPKLALQAPRCTIRDEIGKCECGTSRWRALLAPSDGLDEPCKS